MAQRDVLTIREAETALHLSGPRIHQLLADGQLEGPCLPAGRKRHSPGSPRVTMTSVLRYLERRDAEGRERATRRPRRTQPHADTGQASSVQVSAKSAKAAAQELKVKLDVMREELRNERKRSRELLEVTAKLVELLRSSSASADQLDDVTDGYSEALIPFLAPDTPYSD